MSRRFGIRQSRVDQSEHEIVAALRGAGWSVWVIGRPCDLLCWKDGRGFKTLEVKTRDAKGRIPKRYDQKEQDEFCETTGTPRVTSPFEALLALGEKVEV